MNNGSNYARMRAMRGEGHEPGKERTAPFYEEQDPFRDYYDRRMEQRRGNRMEQRRDYGYRGEENVIGFEMHQKGRGKQPETQRGMGRMDRMQPMDRRTAEEWMRSLECEDGKRGPHWSKEEVKKAMEERDLKGEPMEVWVGMNALFSDLCRVGEMYGHDDQDMDFWLDMAIAFWLCDKDAVPEKLAAYYHYVVEH